MFEKLRNFLSQIMRHLLLRSVTIALITEGVR